ncbi:MAG: FtsX-like permease family protein [Bacteroidetes bacterium]|nr:FtsX-like permease family protein [Bacteroidota bacterium]
MWRNYFTVAIRNISKNKVFTLINVSGLAIGLASAILILLFIIKEKSYDRFHEHANQICRLYIDGGIGEQGFRGAWTSMTMAPTFTEEIPEIEKFVRFDVFNQQLIWFDGEKRIEDHFLFADSSIFDIFSINFLRGDPATALTRPKSVVITREKAREYFGELDPLGLPLSVNRDSNYYVVTGVIEPLPENSHFFADFIASMTTLKYSREETWFQNSIFSYVLLRPGVDREKVEEKMAGVMLKHIRGELEAFLGVGPEEWAADGNRYGVYLQPLKDIHLQPDIEVGLEICFRPVNDGLYIRIFSLVSIFILLIASINFTNLSTAQSAARGREIGLRKVAGSNRQLIISQFLFESVLLSLFALLFGLIIVEISLPLFNRVMELNLRMDSNRNIYLLPMFIILAIMVGLLSGIYPALFMSRFTPVEGFKGAFRGGRRAMLFRNIMVVFQFTISVAIIVGTLIVANQLNYMLSKDLGYEKDNLVVMKRIYPLDNSIQSFCREIEKIPGVVGATNSTTYLGFDNSTETYQIKGRKASKSFLFATNYVDREFMKAYDFRLVGKKGRFFDYNHPGDTAAILINKAAIEEYGIEDPFSTVILETTFEGDTNSLRIIGVVEDFHHSSLYEPIGPYMLRYKPEKHDWSGYITIRLGVAGKGIPSTINKIKKTWFSMTGEAPFQYFFLDEELDNYYREERRTGRLSLLFAILSTLIACLGLFGLTFHNTHRRTREIGIRKAMGASIGEVVLYVSRKIVFLVSVSVMLAWLVAYFFMQEWLRNFPYNIGFKPWIYLSAAFAAILISIAAVSTLAFRAARSNPARVLHHE